MNKKLLLLNKRFLLFFMLTAAVSFGQTTIFQFNFERSVSPNVNNSCGTPSIAQNGQNKILYNPNVPCEGQDMLSSANWKNNEFYRITVNTSGYGNMIFSYCNKGDSGIGNFMSYVSTDNGTTKVPIINSYNVTTTNSTVTSIELPIAANNNGLVYLYIQKVADPNNGSLEFYVDNITLIGTPITTGTVASNATVCSGINSTTLTFSGSAATPTRWESSLDNFLTAGTAIANTTTTLTATNLTATTSYRAVTKNGTCPERYSAAATVTVNTTAAPTVGAITQPNCVIATGSLVLNGLPVSSPWTITASPVTSGLTGLTGSGVSGSVSGLTADTTYSFTVSNGTCTSAPIGNVVINPVITTTYTGTAWSVIPTIDMIGIINSNTAITTNTELCSCTVNTGVVATVASGVTLKLKDKLTANGTLTFENNASLVQVNDVANVGNINYKRLTTQIRNTDYTYWSSPVLGFTLGGVSPRTLNGKFYSYEVSAGSEDWKQESSATIMSEGKGYIIRGPETTITSLPWPPGPYLATFNGVPNNGNYSLSGIFADKSYLIGNPYPSALDANKFLTDNAGVLDGTLYFWTHNTSIGIGVSNPGSGAFAYSGDDYASYNLTGGTATAAAPSDKSTNPNIPTGKIAAGQSFFASSKVSITGSSILFDNSMRVGVGAISGTNSQFFRSAKNAKTALVVEQNRVWLNLFNNEGAFKQALVGYVTGATNNYDNGYDGETFDANEFVDFYSVNQEENLVIQGRALPFDESDKVLLGFRSTAVGNFNIGIDQTDGILKTQNIFVEDKLLNIVHDLKTAPYAFTSLAGTFNDRFVLRFTQKTLGLDSVLPLEKAIVISKYKNELKIKSETETIERITVFDLLGRKIFDKQSINNTEFRIVNNNIVQQILIVKVVLEDGNIISKKIM